jgi:hypothetical protein
VNRSQACVIAAPGGPAHVLLTDTSAEHIPGCNLAVRRSVFDEIGGFRPEYHAAGDDVDFCWRLLERDHVIAFNAAAMVWHYRRCTVKAWLKQQAGYGKAEALLISSYRTRFGPLGGARWRGVVYQSALRQLAHGASRIFSGVFGSAPYQFVYSAPVSETGRLLTGPVWWLLTVAVALNALWLHHLLWFAAAMAALPLIHTAREALRLPLPHVWRGLRARLLLWSMLLLQPVVRGWARLLWNVRLSSFPGGPWFSRTRRPSARHSRYKRVAAFELWSENGMGSQDLLDALLHSLRASGTPVKTDDGWQDWDLETMAGRWWRVRFTCVTEYHSDNKCLTRVRIASRAAIPALLVFWLLPALVVTLVFLTNWHPVWALGTLFAATVLFEMLHRASVNRAANQVVTTATAAGFTIDAE